MTWGIFFLALIFRGDRGKLAAIALCFGIGCVALAFSHRFPFSLAGEDAFKAGDASESGAEHRQRRPPALFVVPPVVPPALATAISASRPADDGSLTCGRFSATAGRGGRRFRAQRRPREREGRDRGKLAAIVPCFVLPWQLSHSSPHSLADRRRR